MQKVRYRAIFRSSGWIFSIWGSIVIIKGLYDAFVGVPESEFITSDKWLKYSGFEVVYGLACLTVGYLIFEFAKRIPEFIET